jgi:hypothetical protein
MPWLWRYRRYWLVWETERYPEPDETTEYCGRRVDWRLV